MNSDATASTRPPLRGTILRIIGHAARILIGLMFVTAGFLKGIDPDEFARQMAGYEIIGPGLTTLATPLLIAFETALGVALLVSFRPRATVVAACALLVFFIAIEAYGLSRGRTEACGCFGAYVQRTPAQVIVEDLFFIGLALLSLWCLRGRAARRQGAAAAAVIAAGALSLGFAVASPRLPLESILPHVPVLKSGFLLTEGQTLEGLGLDVTLSGLERGRHLVALIDVTEPETEGLVPALDALHADPAAPSVVALTPATEEERLAFTLLAFPGFEVHNVDRPVLKPLYRRLPRFFLLEEGRVVSIYDGPVPEASNLLSSEPS